MKNIFVFSLSFFFALIISGVESSTFTITNNCPYTIWPALLAGTGPQLPVTGFQLNSHETTSVNVPSPWSGRIWPRFTCSYDSNGRFSCLSGDCGTGQVACNGAGGKPPSTLVQITLAAPGGTDVYDVSLIDGFNLPVRVTPGGCKTVSCPVDINAQCPPDLAIGNSAGAVIGCKSACVAFNQPQFCCTGKYNEPNKCKPTSYSKFFKSKCPQASTYAFDHKNSRFTCPAGNNYQITFCP